LFYGDNKDVLATLLEQGFRGKIDLIYIDPPFMSGADYVRKVELRGLKETRTNIDDADLLQQTMYFDMWKNDAYLQFMYERLILLKELLSETGSIYVHLDWHVGHYVKLLMDEIFGQDNFVNEIIWFFKGTTNSPRQYGDKHDTILFYVKNKNNNYTFNANNIRLPFDDYSSFKQDEDGKWYKQWTKDKKYYPPQVLKNGKRKLIGKYRYDVIDDVPSMATAHGEEYIGFSTQKKEALLEIFVKASSNIDDLVLDCFIGSGTTCAVAEKLGRYWIGCDINKGALQITSKRLQKIIFEQIKNKKTKHSSFATYKVNNYDLQLLRTEAIELSVQHIGIQRTKTDSFFDGTLGKDLVKIIDFKFKMS